MDIRIRNVRDKFGPAQATSEQIRASDRERAAYVKHHYECEWHSPHLYDAMFNARLGEEAVVEAVLATMKTSCGTLSNHASSQI